MNLQTATLEELRTFVRDNDLADEFRDRTRSRRSPHAGPYRLPLNPKEPAEDEGRTLGSKIFTPTV